MGGGRGTLQRLLTANCSGHANQAYMDVAVSNTEVTNATTHLVRCYCANSESKHFLRAYNPPPHSK